MQVVIRHQTRFRLRLEILHPLDHRASEPVAATILQFRGIRKVIVRPRIQGLTIEFDPNVITSSDLLRDIEYFDPNTVTLAFAERPDQVLASKKSELIQSACLSILGRSLTGFPKTALSLYGAFPFLKRGTYSLIKRKLNAEVLDAIAIGTSIKTHDYGSSSTIGLLLRLGEYLKLKTEHRAKSELIGVLSREHQGAWLMQGGREIWIRAQDLQIGDQVVVRHGGMIPVDGVIVTGQAMLDQSSLTGEGMPVLRRKGARVYGGTLVTEGKIEVMAEKVGDQMRASQILRVVQAAEEKKTTAELKSDRLADRLVPYILSSAGLAYLTTGDSRRASSILLVDYSCALKVSIPIAIQSCLVEALREGILIRGGKYIENLARVNTIVFDKTGTLTEARPKVADIWAASGQDLDGLIRDTACVEEHFPHPVAQAILDEASRRNLIHTDENHGEVKYLVSKGIITELRGRRFIVGNRFFLIKHGIDPAPFTMQVAHAGSSLVYVGIDNVLAGVFIVHDPIRPDSKAALAQLKALGIQRIILLTGDHKDNAKAVATELGFDEFHAEIGPEEKLEIVQKLRAAGKKVAVIGDGMNDAPALSAADVGISFQHGSELAKGAADIILLGMSLHLIPRAITLCRQAQDRVQSNFNWTVGINSVLIGAAFLGVSSPTASAFLHNITTVIMAGRSVRSYSSNHQQS